MSLCVWESENIYGLANIVTKNNKRGSVGVYKGAVCVGINAEKMNTSKCRSKGCGLKWVDILKY